MFSEKMRKIVLMMLASSFVGMNSINVNAQDESINIKEMFDNFINNFGKQLSEIDEDRFELFFKNFKKFEDVVDNQEIKNLKTVESEKLKKLFDEAKRKKNNVAKKNKSTKAQRIVEITEFLKSFGYDKNFDKTKYMVEGFKVYPFRKNNVTFLYYVHERTNFQTIATLTKQNFSSLFFSCPPLDDKGGTHVLEHLLSTPIYKYLATKFGYISHRLFNAQTIEDGFFFLIDNGILDLDVVIKILEELLSPAFLNDKDLLNAEIKRVYNEMKNNEVSKKYAELLLAFLNKYKNGGVSGEILKNTYDDMVKLWKEYVRPNNMLLLLTIGDNPDKIKKILKTIDEKYLQKAPNNDPVDIQYKLKATEKHVKLSKDSPIFKNLHDWKGNSRGDIRYIGSVCFDVKDLSLEEKDALNLWATALENVEDLSEKIKAKGYEFSCYVGNESLNGEVVIRLYGKNKDKFSIPTLTSNVKDILREVGDYFATCRERFLNGEELLVGLNPLTSKKYVNIGIFNKPNKYRKDYNIYHLFFNSKTRYKTPVSDNIFTVRNGEMVDSREEVEKNMMANIETIFKTLANQPVKYVNVVEKSDEVKEKPKEDLLKLTNYKIKGCDKDNDLFRFIEFILKTKANSKVESLGLSYKGLLKAPYFNGNLMCIAHKQSKEDMDNYLNGDFKSVVQKYDLNNLEFSSKMDSYQKNLSREIDRAANLKKILEAYYKSVSECVQSNKILSNKYEIFLELKSNLQDLDVIFDTEEEFLKYRKKVKEFEEGFDYHFSHQKNTKGGAEDEFLEFLINYINFNIKTVVTVHNNLVKLYNNTNSINYDAAKKAIEMNR